MKTKKKTSSGEKRGVCALCVRACDDFSGLFWGDGARAQVSLSLSVLSLSVSLFFFSNNELFFLFLP